MNVYVVEMYGLEEPQHVHGVFSEKEDAVESILMHLKQAKEYYGSDSHYISIIGDHFTLKRKSDNGGVDTYTIEEFYVI